MQIAIIGAGMAGLSCADALAGLGCEVRLFDRGRAPGGRMSTRHAETPRGTASFDHGAQYFTARDPAFLAQVERWAEQGQAARWMLPARDAWVGTPAMNCVVAAMARPHAVRWQCPITRIERTGRHWALCAATERFAGFDAVVLAVPAEQATPFLALHDFAMAKQAMLARSQPCWTGMFVFAEDAGPVRDLVRDEGIIGWAVRNTVKPGRSGPEGWVVQANSRWSQDHLESPPAAVASALLAALAESLDVAVPDVVLATAHRWRYAMSGGLGLGSLWNAELGLGACGDWLLGPRVECAWLSGRDLVRSIAGTPDFLAA